MGSIDENYLTTDLTRETVASGGSFTITAAAGLIGAYGAQITLTGGAGSYAYQEQQITVIDQLRARFYVDPNTLAMASSDVFVIFQVYDASDNQIANVKLQYDGANYEIVSTVIEDDDSWTTIQTDDITDEPHYVEFYLQKASSPTANDGSMETWIDGVSEGSDSTLDLFNKFDPAHVRWGAVTGVDAGTSGTFYLDAIVVNISGEAIGALSSSPVFKDDANLQALWLMEEASGTRYDETDHDNDLTDNNTVESSATCQEGLLSADFERDNSEHLSITDGSQTGLDFTDNFTICAWIRLESLAVEAIVYSKYRTGTNERCVKFRVNAGTSLMECLVSHNGTVYSTCIGGSNLNTATWYHVAVTYDGEYVRIYLDGSLDSNGASNPLSYNSGVNDSTADVRVGMQHGGSNYYDGLIDELAVFDRALGAEEIDHIYNNGIQDEQCPIYRLRAGGY